MNGIRGARAEFSCVSTISPILQYVGGMLPTGGITKQAAVATA
jgi:hypothetical protein